VTAWRLADAPTSLSPFFASAVIEGVVRAPSLFSITFGCPPSITDIQEFVVPRSIPSILDIKKYERLLEAAEEKTDLAELHRIKKDKTSFRELKEYLKRVQSFN